MSISHPPLSAMLYLSAFLHMSFCLSLWGAESLPYLLEFLISCLGCVSDPLFSCPAHIKHSKREKETERRAHRKYISEGIVAKFEVNGRGWLWKESGWRCQDNGKEKSWPLSEKANGKPKRSRKHKAVNYNIHRYASKKVRLMLKALFIL